MIKVGFLGPQGTYSEKAAKEYFAKDNVKLIAYASIPEVFKALRDGQLESGIVPIENSIEGSVNQTLDLLAVEREIKITGEVVMQINHALMVTPGHKIQDIKKVISHGQALAQCSKFLEEKLDAAEVMEALSTAKAAEFVSTSQVPVAAIGHPEMAKIYGLQILDKNIANCNHNETRFIVIGKESPSVCENSKTSIIISITDRPGGLYQLLKEFAVRNINLSKIESRPAKNLLGNYLFFIDFQGTPQEEIIEECLQNINGMAASFRVLGTYRAAVPVKNEEGASVGVSLEQIREDIDIIDRQIVELLAKRTALVRAVGEIKGPKEQIRDSRREEQILRRLTEEAAGKGVSPLLIKRLYGILFDHFVDLQKLNRKKRYSGFLKR